MDDSANTSMTDTPDRRPAGDTEAIDEEIVSSDVLVTGFPGFLASRLLEEILAYQPSGQFFFLVEPRFEQQARRRLSELESRWPDFEGAWEVVPGDITAEDLGFGTETYQRLADRVGTVWHLAALYDLAVEESLAYRVNVTGTTHVLDFCEACRDLKRLNYISTCYISGEREGRIYEDELDEGQGHKNHYESTKFWAEVEVQRRRDAIPTAIFRPGIVVGDSESGETDKYDGPYYLFKFLRKLPRWLPVPNIGKGDTAVNLVPVDFATEAMAFVGLKDGASGSAYHVADPNPMRARDIFSLTLDCMGRRSAIGSIPAGWMEAALGNESIEESVGIPQEAIVYFNHPASYDASNLQRALRDTSIRCPHLSSYLDVIIDYFMEHPEDPAR